MKTKVDAERRRGWMDRLRFYRDSTLASWEQTRDIIAQPLESLKLTQFSRRWLEHRSVAIACFVLDQSPSEYRFHMSLSVRWHTRLVAEADRRGADSSGYRSLSAATSILDAWSAGDLESASALAEVLATDAEVRERDSIPFMVHFSRAILALSRADEDAARRSVDELHNQCEHDAPDFAGYPALMRAALEGDSEAGRRALAGLCNGHARQSTRRGGFYEDDPADQLLCVWGVGLAIRARERQLTLRGIEPLIPDALLFA